MSVTVGDLLKKIAELKKKGFIDDKTILVYSSDEEGNYYEEVLFTPEAWKYDKDTNSFYDTTGYLNSKEKIQEERGKPLSWYHQTVIDNYEKPNTKLVLCIN